MNRNILIVGLILIILVVIAYFTFDSIQSLTGRKTVDLKGNKIELEIADNTEELEKGLSGRDNLAENKGMLFKFSKADRYTFWMKDMKFPIDIVFINGGKVVTIYENVKPMTDEKSANQTLYSPKSPSDRVLELNAGQIKKFGIKEGDTIKLPN